MNIANSILADIVVLSGADEQLVCLWEAGNTTVHTIGELLGYIRNVMEGQVPAAVYVRIAAELAQARLNVLEPADELPGYVDVTYDLYGSRVLVARARLER